jgi:hypothetical protein
MPVPLLPQLVEDGESHRDPGAASAVVPGEAAKRRSGPTDQGIDPSRRLEPSPVRSRLAPQGGAGT